MRVLNVGNLFPPAAVGGYERTWVDGLRALLAAGHDVRVLTSDAPAEGPPPVGVPAPHRELRWYWREHEFLDVGLLERLRLERANAATLRRHLREFQPDVVCWWGLGGMSLSLVEQVRRAGLPAVGVVGDGWMVYGPQHDAWTRGWSRHPRIARLVARATGLPTRLNLGAGARWLFNSEATRARALREHDLPRTGVVHVGVDAAAFPPAPPRAWGWELAYAGRVEEQKGVITAVEALARLPEARLTVTGPAEPGYREALVARAGELGVRDRVAFAEAAADEMPAVYAAADALLFPVTWPEPFGLVPLEAMSVGRPVIATGTGGSGEYLDDGANCLLFPPEDADALARAVRRLADDPALRERLVAGGRGTAARFSVAAFTDGVIAALEDAARG